MGDPETTNPAEGDDLQGLTARGYQFLLFDRDEEVLVCVHRALSLAPGNPIILNNLGNAQLKLSRYEEARGAYQKAIVAQADYVKPYCNLAMLYQLTEQTDKAIAAYRLYMSKAPEDSEAQHNLGLLYI
jgi:Flp pilus assembly protein TadD